MFKINAGLSQKKISTNLSPKLSLYSKTFLNRVDKLYNPFLFILWTKFGFQFLLSENGMDIIWKQITFQKKKFRQISVFVKLKGNVIFDYWWETGYKV